MPRFFVAVALFLLCLSTAVSQTPATMSDAEYKTFLSQLEAALPRWEAAYKNINLEKSPQISYAAGKSIADFQTVGLTEIDAIRTRIYMEHRKRSLRGELQLMALLNNLFDDGEEIVWREVVSGLTLSSLEKYAPEISELSKDLFADIQERITLLENEKCP